MTHFLVSGMGQAIWSCETLFVVATWFSLFGVATHSLVSQYGIVSLGSGLARRAGAPGVRGDKAHATVHDDIVRYAR